MSAGKEQADRTKLVFWQNSLSLHQAPLLRALAKQHDTEVVVVSFGGVSDRRQEMGWTDPDFGNAEVILEPSASDVADIIDRHRDAGAHVFSGFGAYPGVANAIASVRAAKSRAKLIVMTEPWDTRGWLGTLRLMRAYRQVNKVATGLDAVLTCGMKAAKQLAGIRQARSLPIYDFGYFVAPSTHDCMPSDHGHHRIVFVGELSRWKDPLLLLRALSMTTDLPWQLQIVGDGELRAECERMVRDARIDNRVRFAGNISNGEARLAISESDVLVLPSAYDGWGAVVNEALADGVHVIVSDAAGAQDIVVDEMLGERFHTGDEAALARALRRSIEEGHDPGRRRQIREWAERSVSPHRVAQYLVDIVRAAPESVTAPWKEPPTAHHA